MRNLLICTFVAGLAVMSLPQVSIAQTKRMLIHDVYFSLKDTSPKAKEELVAGCKKFLSDHPGTVWFAAGVLVGELDREVNDRDFDVALHIVFKDKASHDNYQKADTHLKFIEEFKDNWKSVRVFDSWLDVSSHGKEKDHPRHTGKGKELFLPDAAIRFAGMIQGKVVSKHDKEIVVAVEKVTKVWRTNKATNPKALVGKKVIVNGSSVDGHPVKTIAKFIGSLKVGENITVDVAHRGKREVLTILELTEDQREQISEK